MLDQPLSSLPLPWKPGITPPLTGDTGFSAQKWLQVLYFDPAPILTRLHGVIDPYRRRQSLSMVQVWPNESGICACGCRTPLQAGRRRWASTEHTWLPLQVFRILQGDQDLIRHYITRYHGPSCHECRGPGDDLDHIVPVKHRGGGAWLGNYQLLCTRCHRIKTNRDFGWKQVIRIPPLGLFGE